MSNLNDHERNKKSLKTAWSFFYDAKYHTKISLFSSQAQQDPLSPLLLFLLFFWSSNAVSCFDNWVITTSHCTTFNPLSMAFFHTCQHSQKESSHTYQSFYFKLCHYTFLNVSSLFAPIVTFKRQPYGWFIHIFILRSRLLKHYLPMPFLCRISSEERKVEEEMGVFGMRLGRQGINYLGLHAPDSQKENNFQKITENWGSRKAPSSWAGWTEQRLRRWRSEPTPSSID